MLLRLQATSAELEIKLTALCRLLSIDRGTFAAMLSHPSGSEPTDTTKVVLLRRFVELLLEKGGLPGRCGERADWDALVEAGIATEEMLERIFRRREVSDSAVVSFGAEQEAALTNIQGFLEDRDTSLLERAWASICSCSEQLPDTGPAELAARFVWTVSGVTPVGARAALNCLARVAEEQRGYVDQEVQKLRREAWLFPSSSESAQFYDSLSRWQTALITGQYPSARRVAEALLAEANRSGQKNKLLEGHRACGEVELYAGCPKRALTHLKRCQAIYHQVARSTLPRELVDAGPASACHASLAEWILGRPERALRTLGEARRLARKSGQDSVEMAEAYSGLLATFLCENRRVVNTLEDLAGRGRNPVWKQCAIALRGLAGFHLASNAEDPHAAFSMFEEAFAAYRSTGTAIGEAYWTVARVEAMVAMRGDLDDAFHRLHLSQQLCEESGEQFWVSELLSWKGLVLRRQGLKKEGRKLLKNACVLAKQHNARSLVLRAALRWAKETQSAASRTALKDALRRFREGRRTREQQTARALLRNG